MHYTDTSSAVLYSQVGFRETRFTKNVYRLYLTMAGRKIPLLSSQWTGLQILKIINDFIATCKHPKSAISNVNCSNVDVPRKIFLVSKNVLVGENVHHCEK